MLLQEIIYPPIVLLNFIMLILAIKKSCKIQESNSDWAVLMPYSTAYFVILVGMSGVNAIHVDIIFALLVIGFILHCILFHYVYFKLKTEKFDLINFLIIGYTLSVAFYVLHFNVEKWT